MKFTLIILIFSTTLVFGQTTTFTLKKAPNLLETITTHAFFGNRNNQGFKFQNYDAPLFLKLYQNNTFMMFNSELVGDSLDYIYHYFSKQKGIYRGSFTLDSNDLYELAVIKGNLNCKFQLKAIPTKVGGTATIKTTFDFTMYKGALSRSYNGAAKPTLFPVDGSTDLLEMYPLEAYYKLVNMSAENQEALKLLYPEMFENQEADSTGMTSN